VALLSPPSSLILKNFFCGGVCKAFRNILSIGDSFIFTLSGLELLALAAAALTWCLGLFKCWKNCGVFFQWSIKLRLAFESLGYLIKLDGWIDSKVALFAQKWHFGGRLLNLCCLHFMFNLVGVTFRFFGLIRRWINADFGVFCTGCGSWGRRWWWRWRWGCLFLLFWLKNILLFCPICGEKQLPLEYMRLDKI